MSNEQTLDLVAVGLGGAGGRIAAELHRRGYRALALSPSSAELDAIARPDGAGSAGLPKDKRIHLPLEGHRGTGGDPEVGARCVLANSSRIRDAVRAEAQGAAGVIVVGGLGGGTGSALATLVETLGHDAGPVIAMATLPTQGENAHVKANAARAAAALTRASADGLVFIDNARIVDLHADLPLLDYNERVNALIADPLDALNRVGGRADLTAIRGLDRNALRGLLFGGGVLTYAVNELDTFSAEAISNSVVDSLYASWLVAAGIEPRAVSALAIVVEAPDSVLRSVPVRVVEQLREQWKADTEGGSVELGVYRSADEREGIVVRTLASCSALPARLVQLVDEASAELRAMADKRRSVPELDVSKLDELPAAPVFARPAPLPVLDKRPSSRPLPSPVATEPEAARPMLASLPVADQEEIVTKRKSRPSEDELEAPPGRAAYARIVGRYRSTSDEEVRRGIADRLEQDRLSPHSAVRYHAVDAMAKLGLAVFENALLAATEDPDPAVRVIASRALDETRRAHLAL